jgi:hypothetical protein
MDVKRSPGADKPDLVEVTLTVSNNSGSEISNVTPHILNISGGAYDSGRTPASLRSLTNGKRTSFLYTVMSDAALRISASASATGPSGQLVSVGPVACQ